MAKRRGALRSLWVPIVGALTAWVLRALGASWRVRIEGDDPIAGGLRPLVGALWHRSFLTAAALYRDLDAVVIVSRSRDGDLIEAVLRRLGYAASPRGSSSRGASSALRGQIRLVAEGHMAALLCDGPKGPLRRAKPGVLALARSTGAALVPVAMSARPAIRFGSWDRTVLPLPFSRVVVRYGAPMRVAADVGDAAFETARRQLEEALDRLTDALDASLGLPIDPRDGGSPARPQGAI